MTAAALSRSRGVTGVRTTKGLFFTFTLLSLVCLTSSLIDKEQLGLLKERLQNLQQRMDRVKAARAYAKKTFEASPDSPGFLENIKDFFAKTMTYLDGNAETLDAEIEKIEQELGKIRKLITFLEEQQAEL